VNICEHFYVEGLTGCLWRNGTNYQGC